MPALWESLDPDREEDALIRAARELLGNTDLRVGDSLTFKVFRDGKTLDVVVELEELPKRTG